MLQSVFYSVGIAAGCMLIMVGLSYVIQWISDNCGVGDSSPAPIFMVNEDGDMVPVHNPAAVPNPVINPVPAPAPAPLSLIGIAVDDYVKVEEGGMFHELRVLSVGSTLFMTNRTPLGVNMWRISDGRPSDDAFKFSAAKIVDARMGIHENSAV